jgi:flagellar FliJ protein
MKRFRFRLQRILDIREQIRDEARQELGRRNAELAHEESVLRGLEQELQRLRAEGDGIVTAGEYQLMGAYAVRVQKLIEQQYVKIDEARKRVLEAQEKYIQANKDAKALELLKERKREEYDKEILREEINQLDEVATQRAATRK